MKILITQFCAFSYFLAFVSQYSQYPVPYDPHAFLHCSIALAFGHQFPTVEACVLYGEGHVVFVVDRVALGQDFLSVLQFHTLLLCIVAFGRRSLDSLEAEVLTHCIILLHE
jgi:hypothetical protein